jgi:hypothetical protein
MRKIHFYNFLVLISTVSSCQNKTNIAEKSATKEKAKCVILYDKYIEKFSARENDSALYYIDKCIKCDPSKNDNKYAKVQLLISMRDYKNAILVFSDFKLDDPALKMQKGVLMLKINDTKAENILQESFLEFCKIKELTSSNQFYKIALDNYFKGKEYALEEINKFKVTFKGKDYETQNINALESLIKSENKENVLFKVFNIRN